MNKPTYRLLLAIGFLITAFPFCALSQDFTKIKNGQFYLSSTSSQPSSLKGMAMWYAPLYGTKNKHTALQKRLKEELDSLKSIGINTLTILAGANINISERKDSLTAYETALEPFSTNKVQFQGLDYCLNELRERGMKAIVNLSPRWSQEEGFNSRYKAFAESLFKLYSQNETILSWQLCDIPYPVNPTSYNSYCNWCKEMATFIKEKDANHLVSAAYTPISKDSQKEYEYFSRLTNSGSIDFFSIIISPYHQNWVNRGNLFDGLAPVYLLTSELLQSYNRSLQNRDLPFIIQVSYPRDGAYTGIETSTNARNEFFTYISSIASNAPSELVSLQGVSFNGWGGSAQPQQGGWKSSQGLLAEYPDEKKGQYSIFTTDTTTTQIISKICLNQPE